MAGIELVKDIETKEPFPPELRVGHRVILEARGRGVILRPLGDVIVVMSNGAFGGLHERLMDALRSRIEAARSG